MDFFEKLEFNKLIKELDFINSDLIYKSSLLKLADEIFIKDVNEVLVSYPKLKTILDEKIQKRLEIIECHQNQPKVEVEETNTEVEIIHESKDPKLKSLYYRIARSTHPDVNGNENLNEVYLDAQKAYDSNDLIQIFSICDKLRIEYEISNEEFGILKSEIDLKKQRIEFLESTYTWKWYHEQSFEEKNRIIINYLESQMSK